VPEKTGAREAGEDFGGRGSSVADSALCAATIIALPLKTISERRALEPKA
jgi:hypothetical protein